MVALICSATVGMHQIRREFDFGERRLKPAEAFALSRLDDDWQIEQWGEDDEASKTAALKAQEFKEAARLIALVR